MIVISLPVILVGLYLSFERHLAKSWMRWGWWVCSALVVALVGWHNDSRPGWWDFTNAYYHAGRLALSGLTQSSPAQLYNQGICTDGFVNFPLLAYLFVPFGFLPSEVAGRIFYVISYVSIIPLSYWLIKIAGLGGWKRWLMLGLLAINDSLDNNLWLGNTTQFIMICIMISLWWFIQGKEMLSGILLGFSGLIKLPLILSSGYFFVRQRWRVVMGGLFIAGLAIILSLILIPSSFNHEWLNKCIFSYSSGGPVVAHNNQSVTAFLGRYMLPESDVFSWVPVASEPRLDVLSKIFVAVLYLPIVLMLLIDRKLLRTSFDHILEFSIILVCSLLTSPISWTHYYMLLLIPAALYLKVIVFTRSRFWPNLLFGCSLVLLSTPSSSAIALFEHTGERIFLSSYFVGGVLLYILLLALWFSKRYDSLRKSSTPV